MLIFHFAKALMKTSLLVISVFSRKLNFPKMERACIIRVTSSLQLAKKHNKTNKQQPKKTQTNVETSRYYSSWRDTVCDNRCMTATRLMFSYAFIHYITYIVSVPDSPIISQFFGVILWVAFTLCVTVQAKNTEYLKPPFCTHVQIKGIVNFFNSTGS